MTKPFVAAESLVALGATERRLDEYANYDIMLGSLRISRALPVKGRRLIGPWCFLDRFGPLSFTDTTHTMHNPGLGFPDRSFTNFLDAANEAAVSRLYGGIHYAFDNQDGFNQGQCVGSIINTQIDFRQ